MPRSRRWTDLRRARVARRPATEPVRRAPGAARDHGDDAGSASIEFVVAGLVLLVPLIYLVLAMSAIQGAALTAEGAARQGARVFVQAADDAAGQAAAVKALEFALADQGLRDADASVQVQCSATPCLTRRELVTVRVEIAVPLPLVPPVLQGSFPLAVPLTADATQQVSRFWGAGG